MLSDKVPTELKGWRIMKRLNCLINSRITCFKRNTSIATSTRSETSQFGILFKPCTPADTSVLPPARRTRECFGESVFGASLQSIAASVDINGERITIKCVPVVGFPPNQLGIDQYIADPEYRNGAQSMTLSGIETRFYWD